MNSYFNTGDWVIILIYLLGIIALGLWFGKDQHNTRDYFLGSKNVPWWGIGMSIVAAETSALTIIGVPAMAYGGNIAFIQMIIGYVIARIILAIVLVPHYFKGEIYSPYQLFADTFGHSARQTAGGFFLISETLAAGVRVYVASIPVKLMLGDKVLSLGLGDPIFGAIFLFVVLSLLYTYVGGVKAVIWTDAVQFALFLLGGVFALCYIPTLVEGGLGGLFAKATAAGKLHWLNAAPAPGASFAQFLLDKPFNIWMGVIALAERRPRARRFLRAVPPRQAVQHLDGRHRRHGHGDVLPRRRATHRAARPGLQERRRRPQGPHPQRGGYLPPVSDLPAGGRHAVGVLPGPPLPDSAARDQPRLGHHRQ